MARNGVSTEIVEIGINEFQTGISCVNDISTRLKPTTEEKNPDLLAEIHAIMEPHSETESSLRTTLLYTNMTAKTVFDALVQKGMVGTILAERAHDFQHSEPSGLPLAHCG